ncbi:amidohydrolase [Clostridiaceae bacterium 35-E11]
MQLEKIIEENKQYIIDLRRDFHMYPEESWKEFRTEKKIKEALDAIGIPYRSLGEVGVLGTIEGHKKGKVVCLRADIDALSIEEKTDLPFRSKNQGVMHACGHDGHIAILLGAAKALHQMKNTIKGTIKLLFQPAEEAEHVGAPVMIEKGALEGVDAIFGLHLMNNLKTGEIALGEGTRLASCDEFKIVVEGKGGHGAAPHEGVDAMVASAAILINLQTLVSREINAFDPVVVSVGTIQSGDAANIIASKAEMVGTCRCFNLTLRENLPKKIQRIVENTARAFGAEATLFYHKNISPLHNDKACYNLAVNAATEIVDSSQIIDFPKEMGADDFAEYTLQVPGLYAGIGSGGKDPSIAYPAHHEKFTIDEDALEIGTKFLAKCAIHFLKS